MYLNFYLFRKSQTLLRANLHFKYKIDLYAVIFNTKTLSLSTQQFLQKVSNRNVVAKSIFNWKDLLAQYL